MTKGGYVYIMTNEHNTVLYTGVTENLVARIGEHRDKVYPKSFTARYNVYKLVHFEFFQSIEAAIEREKQIKAGPRKAKEKLILMMNAEWRDLFSEVQDFI
jgi:putative endonuclease